MRIGAISPGNKSPEDPQNNKKGVKVHKGLQKVISKALGKTMDVKYKGKVYTVSKKSFAKYAGVHDLKCFDIKKICKLVRQDMDKGDDISLEQAVQLANRGENQLKELKALVKDKTIEVDSKKMIIEAALNPNISSDSLQVLINYSFKSEKNLMILRDVAEKEGIQHSFLESLAFYLNDDSDSELVSVLVNENQLRNIDKQNFIVLLESMPDFDSADNYEALVKCHQKLDSDPLEILSNKYKEDNFLEWASFFNDNTDLVNDMDDHKLEYMDLEELRVLANENNTVEDR